MRGFDRGTSADRRRAATPAHDGQTIISITTGFLVEVLTGPQGSPVTITRV
ncbi:hypothetical protein ACFQ60_01925 [Streptomyces zhihengii]